MFDKKPILPSVITLAIIIFIIAITIYSFGIGWYNIETDYHFNNGKADVSTYVYHNCDIVVSEYAWDIPLERVDTVQYNQIKRVKQIIHKLKTLK